MHAWFRTSPDETGSEWCMGCGAADARERKTRPDPYDTRPQGRMGCAGISNLQRLAFSRMSRQHPATRWLHAQRTHILICINDLIYSTPSSIYLNLYAIYARNTQPKQYC